MSHIAYRRVAKRSISWRLAEAVTGHSFKIAEEWLVDRFIYTLVIGYFVNLHGSVMGGLYGLAVMFPVTAVLCYLYIWGYNKLKRDLFGFELIKELKDDNGSSRTVRTLKWIARQSDILAFFLLSAWKDAFMATIYLKKEPFKPLTKRDHAIFWASLLVSNAWWALLITGLTSAIFWIIDFPVVWQVWDAFSTAFTDSAVYVLDALYRRAMGLFTPEQFFWFYLLIMSLVALRGITLTWPRKRK